MALLHMHDKVRSKPTPNKVYFAYYILLILFFIKEGIFTLWEKSLKPVSQGHIQHFAMGLPVWLNISKLISLISEY